MFSLPKKRQRFKAQCKSLPSLPRFWRWFIEDAQSKKTLFLSAPVVKYKSWIHGHSKKNRDHFTTGAGETVFVLTVNLIHGRRNSMISCYNRSRENHCFARTFRHTYCTHTSQYDTNNTHRCRVLRPPSWADLADDFCSKQLFWLLSHSNLVTLFCDASMNSWGWGCKLVLLKGGIYGE